MTLKNTNENASITLVSRQSAGNELDKTEFTVRGGFYEKDGKFYITYPEKSEAGMGNSRVLLKIEPNMVTMRRMGDFGTVIQYKNGEVTEFVYRVPYGEMTMKIKTQSIQSSLGADGGELEFSYLLFAGGEIVKTEINISVKKESE